MNQPVSLPAESPPEPPLPVLAPEDYPNLDDLVFEDNTPVDSIFAEREMRLLTEPLDVSWKGGPEGRAFLALANVALFGAFKEPPEVPDALLSLDVEVGDDLEAKENRSYLVWVLGKAPDVVVEIVSDRRGGKDAHKLRRYARWRVLYYVIFDPYDRLGQGVLRAFAFREGVYEPIEASWFPQVGLGLKLWEGEYKGHRWTWLRWCDREGNLIPTPEERVQEVQRQAAEERQRAEEAEKQMERLRAQLRALGIDPDA